jgi:3-hydroxyisobutyrate dehydrogenase-like beta-hydroxyacid dehydrogenase
VLRAYCSEVVHTGPVGTAQVAKAVNNLIMWACLVADHEGLALAQSYGVDIDALRSAFAEKHRHQRRPAELGQANHELGR